MNHHRRLIIASAAATFVRYPWAQQAAWPARPLRLVAGGAGSVTDIRARWLAERLSRAIGQPVIVENNGAAGGNVGAESVARSAPDGYSLMFVHQGLLAVNPHLYARPGFDALNDFAPITRFGIGPLMLTVHAQTPIASVQELVRAARDKPDALTFGSPGIGTPPHLASELFVRAAGIRARHIPYKGGGALLSAHLGGGQITWSMEGMTVQLPHVKGGRLRALATTGSTRSPSLPEVPTIAEAGVPGYDYQGWTGLAAPAATPRVIVERLHAEIAHIADTAEAREWFAAIGAEAGLLAPAAFDDFVRAEHARWGQVIRDAHIKVE